MWCCHNWTDISAEKAPYKIFIWKQKNLSSAIILCIYENYLPEL